MLVMADGFPAPPAHSWRAGDHAAGALERDTVVSMRRPILPVGSTARRGRVKHLLV
jgi:hypothetical protein